MAHGRTCLVIPVDGELLCPQLAPVRCMTFFMREPVVTFSSKEERLRMATAAWLEPEKEAATAGEEGVAVRVWGSGLE